jgi:hypothetical protein
VSRGSPEPRGAIGEGGVGTTGAIAKAYGVFAAGGSELALRRETIEALTAPAIRSEHGFFDDCLGGLVEFSLGFMKPSESFPFGHAGAFGAPGAGGSMGPTDPVAGIGNGYVTNRMRMNLHGDPRRRAPLGDPGWGTDVRFTTAP